MIEKFSDYESVCFLNKEGDFEFEVKSAELTESKKGSLMVKLEVESRQAGKSTLYHTLDPKARWSYNNLIKACLHDKLDTPEKVEAFELDYETIHNELVGKHFIGHVEIESYTKEVKVPLDDGTFDTTEETVDSYKIKSYKPVV